MQAFDFQLDSSSLSSALYTLLFILMIVVTVAWSNGYAYKDPHIRNDPYAGLPRARLWAAIAAGIGICVMLVCALTWDAKFSRLELYESGIVKLWFGDRSSKIVILSKSDIDSIHYGLAKHGGCYIRIQLNGSKSYESTLMPTSQCSTAYHALKGMFPKY